MAIAVSKDDLFEGHSAKLTQTGWEITRVFKVTGLSGSNPEDKSCAAVDAVMTAKSLTIGTSAYPQTLRGIENARLRTITPVMKDHDTCFVTCFYSQEVGKSSYTEFAIIESGASVIQEESNVDINGNIVSLSYTYSNSRRGINPELAGTTQTASEPIPVFKPQSEYVVRINKATNPTSDSIAYVGKVNSNNGFIVASDAGKWLCTAIRGTSSDNGSTWDVTRVFQYNVEGWNNRLILYRDDTTGKVPADVFTQASAYDTPQMYDTANMAGLLT